MDEAERAAADAPASPAAREDRLLEEVAGEVAAQAAAEAVAEEEAARDAHLAAAGEAQEADQAAVVAEPLEDAEELDGDADMAVDGDAAMMAVATRAEEEEEEDVDGERRPASAPRAIEAGGQRRLARSTLEAVGARAAGLSDSLKSSSSVLRFGMETVGLLMSPVNSLSGRAWQSYGSPLLNQFDEKLDLCIDAIQEQQRLDEEAAAAAAGGARRRDRSYSEADGGGAGPAREGEELDMVRHRQAETTRVVFWDQLKARFMNCRWFSRVDDILKQNAVYSAVDRRVVRPAEAFFNTATEAFMAGGDSFESFIDDVKERMGPDWDGRLATPAAAFFHTSVAVRQIVGASRFLGGAMQLGKQKLNSAIDDLIEKWDGLLISAQDRMDTVMPDLAEGGAGEGRPASVTDGEEEEEEEEGADAEGAADAGGSGADDDGDIFSMEDVAAADGGEEAAPAASGRKRAREGSPSGGVMPLVQNASKRLRQRLPLLREMPHQLRHKVLHSAWFVQADAILRDNSVVRLMQDQLRAAYSTAVQPAEHFYNTSVVSFRANTASVGGFLCDLRARMGSAWDDRLRPLAVSFFTSASSAGPATSAAAASPTPQPQEAA